MSKILILDLETTGFLNQNGKIVEIGIVELDLTDGSRKIIYNQVCHEKGITMEEVSDSWIVQNSDLNIKILSEMIVIEIKKKKINKLSSNK